jgi:ABC-type nitrate/sulfonate/bicarbonate transport system substrate-binding protein
MRLAVPDLVSNSYFPAIAAAELGFLHDEGIDADLELMFPVTDAAAALRDGEIDFLAGGAHAPFHVDPEWSETRLLAALARNMYWFLVVRADLDPLLSKESLTRLRDVRIGAAPGPDLGLRRLLAEAGIDTAAVNITIAPVPGTDAADVSFGVTAAQALADGRIDAFWANGMGTEVAVRRGTGRVVLDARRDGGAPALFTFPALMTSRRIAEQQPETAAAVTRAVMRAQRELRASPELATKVGRSLFPDMEAGLIAGLIERDLDFYEPALTPEMLAGLARFAESAGLTDAAPGPDVLVPATIRRLWS